MSLTDADAARAYVFDMSDVDVKVVVRRLVVNEEAQRVSGYGVAIDGRLFDRCSDSFQQVEVLGSTYVPERFDGPILDQYHEVQ